MDIADDMICDNDNFSMNILVFDSSMQDIIPSSRGRISITYPTSRDVPSDDPSTVRDKSEIFANKMQPPTVVTSSLPTNYSHLTADSDISFGTSPPHVSARLRTKLLTDNALRHTHTSKTHSYVCRIDEQIPSLGLTTLVSNFYDAMFDRYGWSKTAYAGATEEVPVPDNIPRLKGKPVKLIIYADSNLCHNILERKTVAGILHYKNQTPFDWYANAKKQATTETATLGAEELTGRTEIEQCRANRLTLMCLGVPIEGPSILLGDNKSVVKSATTPHSKLSKRHLILFWHYLRQYG